MAVALGPRSTEENKSKGTTYLCRNRVLTELSRLHLGEESRIAPQESGEMIDRTDVKAQPTYCSRFQYGRSSQCSMYGLIVFCLIMDLCMVVVAAVVVVAAWSFFFSPSKGPKDRETSVE
jgi:hypothetical protein